MPRDMPMGAAPVCVAAGAGSGGLAAAARARARGLQVRIVDRQQGPDSRARTQPIPAPPELPGLSQHPVAERSLTPQGFRHGHASRHGAGLSTAPTLLRSAWSRLRNRSPLPGLCLVGAGTHPGAGVLTSALANRLLQADCARVLP